MALFFTALFIGYSGAMMPGPLLTYCIERSLHRGWKVGLLVPLGHVLLELILVVLIVLGMGSFMNRPWPKIVILFVGGAVLVWFGADMIKSAAKGVKLELSNDMGAAKGRNLEIMAKSGAISLLNPYFILWWATIGLSFMMANTQLGVWGIVIFYAGHASADISWYFAVSLLCSKISRFIAGKPYDAIAVSDLPLRKRVIEWMKRNPYRIIIGGLGGVLVFFAVKFIVDGILLLVSII